MGWKSLRSVSLLALLVSTVLLLPCDWKARGSEVADNYLRRLERTVKDIAGNASVFYETTYDHLSTCSIANCSRRECDPVKELDQPYQCAYIFNFSMCAESSSTCTWGSVDYSRALVGLPGPTTTNYLDFLQKSSALGSTICAQRNLDTVFTKQNNVISYPNEQFFYQSYYGSADGTARTYPAREALNADCDVYDPRIRPWYLNAISVQKDVVILLDTSHAMVADTDFFTSETVLGRAKFLTLTLVQTFTPGDTFTLIAVNETGAFLQLSQSINDAANTDIRELVNQALQSETFVGTQVPSRSPSKLLAGFKLANETLLGTSPSTLKVVFFITDSLKNSSPNASGDINSTLAKLKQEGNSLFVYDLKTSQPSAWEGISCQWNADANVGTAGVNPLLFLNGYFSHLARARIKANNGVTVYWSQSYLDKSNLGPVITISCPAMSSDNRTLIGVAAIDVQTGSLSTNFQDDLKRTLSSQAYQYLTRIPTFPFTDPISCSKGYGNSCSSNLSIVPLCKGANPGPATDDELKALQCCKPSGSGGACLSRNAQRSTFVRHKWIIIPFIILGGTILLCPCLASWFYFHNKWKDPQNFPRTQLSQQEGPECSGPSDFVTSDSTLAEHTLELYPYEVLSEATHGFHKSTIIGEGGFGVVYRGTLGNQQVAIKKFKKPADHDRVKAFEKEFRISQSTNHTNLVKLLGRCFRKKDCCLVYEYIENDNLHSWLWPLDQDVTNRPDAANGTKRFLTWDNREHIARGVALGLDYMHRGLLHGGQVFHLDVKPNNILLDKNFSPKLGDFGNSQLYKPEYALTTVRMGTPGYIPPEVLEGPGSRPNSKMDVYSFGLVLLQLLCGRPINDPEVQPLGKWARELVQHGHPEIIIAKDLCDSVHPTSIKNLKLNCERLINLALQCTENDPDKRPEMYSVLGQIQNFERVKNRKGPGLRISEVDSQSLLKLFTNNSEQMG